LPISWLTRRHEVNPTKGENYSVTVAEIATFACQTTGDISSDAYDYAKRAIALKYATLYDSHNWREATRVVDGVIMNPALSGALFLPWDADEIVFLSLSYDSQNYIRLTYRERDWIERFVAPRFNLPGNTPWYYRAENLAWPELSPGNFTFTTIEPSPFNVYIAGRDANDFPISESFILQASKNPDGSVNASSITTVNSYKLVTVLSKSVTSTVLSVTAGATGLKFQVAPAMTEFVFTQMVLYPAPIFFDTSGKAQNVYLRLEAKLKPDLLNDEMSVPRISHIWDALICFTLSSLYKRMHQMAKAKSEETDAMDHVKAAINVEKNQASFRQQVVPTVYESGNYLWGGYPHRATSWNPFAGP
jgi:hypothetical protein